jgi:endonuclease VIII
VPEGQVSHRNAIRLTAALAGRELVRIEAPEPRLTAQRIPERLTGDRVRVVEAAGKHHLIRFASGRTLHSHLMMNGLWRLLAADRPLRRSGLWLALWTADHVAAQYRGPVLRLLEPGEEPAAVARLGPDLLSEDVDPGAAAARGLARLEPGTTVGEALLDQRVVAGIGNVYKSETCFLCGIDPWRTVGSLGADEAASLGATAARLLAEGVREWAITTYRGGGPSGSSRERTWVYGRRGRPCRRCGTPVRARGQGDANRITYWCPQCQG